MENYDTTGFLLENATDERLLKEVTKIDSGDISLRKSCGFDVGEAGTIGCEYRKGTFIINSVGEVVYQKKCPHYYSFLSEWYHK